MSTYDYGNFKKGDRILYTPRFTKHGLPQAPTKGTVIGFSGDYIILRDEKGAKKKAKAKFLTLESVQK